MDRHSGSGVAGGNVGEFQPGNSGNSVDESMSLESSDLSVWAAGNGMSDMEASIHTNSDSNDKGRLSEPEVESEAPNKRGESSILLDLAAPDAPKAIRKLLYKTTLCCQFQAGTCPFGENCDFAHSIEELTVRPSNWHEILALFKEEPPELSELKEEPLELSELKKEPPELSGPREEPPELSEPREVFQIPVMESTNEATQRRHIKQHCWRFFSEVGCQYGDNCIYDHNEYEDRQSEAICLLPGTGQGHESNQSKLPLNASKWKTRICNNWELSGFCAFGSNCRYAHGFAELQWYNGGLVNREAKGSSGFATNQVAAPAKASVPYSYHVGSSSRRPPNVIPKTGEVPIRKWKGPNKISKVYGDWIDDL